MKKERFIITLSSPELQASILRDFNACIEFATNSESSSFEHVAGLQVADPSTSPFFSASDPLCTIGSWSAWSSLSGAFPLVRLAVFSRPLPCRDFPSTSLPSYTPPKAASQSAARRLFGSLAG